jgi:peptide methionine sulfoxide reductase msrA/msrB
MKMTISRLKMRIMLMKIRKTSTRTNWLILAVALCLTTSAVFAARLLSSRMRNTAPVQTFAIDDFSRAAGNRNHLIWKSVSDRTEDFTRADSKSFIQDAGRSCLNIKDAVPRGKSLVLLGSKPELANHTEINVGEHDGIYLKAKGTPGRLALGIWIESEQNGRHLYQAPVDLINRWQEFRLPLRVFRKMPADVPGNDREVFRIMTVPNVRQRTVEILFDEIGFYKERAMYIKLTPEQRLIFFYLVTERPFSGKYNNHYEKGTYVCARCAAPLYESSSKFKSNCGWPSFDDQIEGAVKWQRDADGVRTEILCNNCGGHLGHVFLGENYTPKNTRHCVNSLSMDFIPASEQQDDEQDKQEQKSAKAIFASGCFWGTEYYFNKAPGVISTTVGYTGGHVPNPTYKQVCSDKTGHAEAVEVEYDPNVISYEQLAKLFFETHDFTQLNRQGPDIGRQYRSGIFYLDDEQKKVAEQLRDELKGKGYNVKTEITKADRFWRAEEYHQDYYDKTKKTPYCHVYRKIF